MSDVGLVGWAKYFQQSAQSNFIHKFLRQITANSRTGGSVAQNQSENIQNLEICSKILICSSPLAETSL